LYSLITYYDDYGYDSGASVRISQGMGVFNIGYKFRKQDLSVGANVKVLYNNVPVSLLAAKYGNNLGRRKQT
jgi:hypothetical protein